MAIITLTTDFGLKDYYVPAVKGAILSECPEAVILDITHDTEVFNYMEAAFILKNAYPHFPKGSIHIIGVNSLKNKNEAYVAIYADGHYFVGTDNGFFSLVLDVTPEYIAELEETVSTTFPVKDIFAKAACRLAKKEKVEALGASRPSLITRMARQAYSNPDSIKGEVVYIDKYENAITNIMRTQFEETAKQRPFAIQLKPSRSYANAYKDTLASFNYSIGKISAAYNEVTEGEIVALFNSAGYLEIAINSGKAARLLGLKVGEPIQVFFED